MPENTSYLPDLFRALLSPAEIITARDAMNPYQHDWRRRYQSKVACVLKPKSTAAVQAVMALAAEHRIKVTPQGGNTSLCGGAVPAHDDGVILALGALNKVRSFIAADRAITVDAGITLAALQDYAAAAGYFFPLNLASKGSCQLGGNIACNAGGLNVLRFGTVRDLVLGLEVVTPGGELISNLTPLHKNTAGLNLKELLIGSEGTLGVITAATVKVYPPPAAFCTVLIAVHTLSEVLVLLALLQENYNNELTSFEYMSAAVWALTAEFSGITVPLPAKHLVLAELSFNHNSPARQEEILSLLHNGGFREVIWAKSAAERQQLWRARENISAAQKKLRGITVKHDIAVPIAALPQFLPACERAVKQVFPAAEILVFGHCGDGSLHYNIALTAGVGGVEVYQQEERLNELVYGEVLTAGGTIAAEHGIGRLKTAWLPKIKTPGELSWAAAVKKAADPLGIMNPGVIWRD